MPFYPTELETKLLDSFPYILPALKGRDCLSMDASAIVVGTLCKAHGVDPDTALDWVAPAHFVHLWRSHRVIYAIDRDLAAELQAQAVAIREDEDLPVDLLMGLPYPCFAAESAPFEVVSRDGETGEIVHRAPFTGRFMLTVSQPGEFGNPWPALSVLFETPGGNSQYYLPIPTGGTLEDSLRLLLDYYKSVERPGDPDYTMDLARQEAVPVLFAAQIVLYIQAKNADLQNRPVSVPRKKNRRSAMPRKKPEKVVEVGYHVGKLIRKSKSEHGSAVERAGTGGGWTVRPHARRGHWHRYWTGPKNEPDKRKLELKWTHPTFIHGDKKDDKPTVYKVAKKPDMDKKNAETGKEN